MTQNVVPGISRRGNPLDQIGRQKKTTTVKPKLNVKMTSRHCQQGRMRGALCEVVSLLQGTATTRISSRVDLQCVKRGCDIASWRAGAVRPRRDAHSGA